MGNLVQVILRGLQFFWTLLIMALTGNMIAMALGGNPSIVNYDMFVAVFSMLTLFYQFLVLFNDGFAMSPAIPLALDGLNTLFFLCGGIALAAWMGVHSCGDSSYTDFNVVTAGSTDNGKRCQEGQATCAFLWFGFAAYAASLILGFFGGSGSGVNLRGGAGGIRRGGPSMSQMA